MKTILRRIRGTLGTALVWGGVWFVASFGVAMGYLLLGLSGATLSWEYLGVILLYSGFQGLVGFVTGGAFSTYVAGTFRNNMIEDLSPTRFALGGALVTIPFVLLLMIWINSQLGYEWIFLSELIRPVAISATLGGLTGYGTVKLAQKAVEPGASAGKLEPGSERLLNQN